ncbi:MAG: hypothetical protein JWO64_3469 [Hyphomicrobiales bacterium]|nr:hypothetical protein [Hyphomicrobiales bacterium]
MNEHPARRKGFPRLVATLPGLALFLSLASLASVGGAQAQYIPPPPSQTFAPAQGVTTTAPAAAPAAPSRKTTARARKRVSEPVVAEEAAPAEPRKARAHRMTRAEKRAAARQARAEARAEARAAATAKKKTRVTKAAANPDEEDEAPAPATQANNKLTILAGQPQTTAARGAQELVDLMKAVNLDAEAKTGPISIAQLSETDGADLAILQSDTLEEARRDTGANLQRKLTFIARLFNQEIHIVARPGVKTFAELDGRTIATSALDTPEGRTAAKLFERAGIRPRLLEMDTETALARLGRGEIDGAIFVGGKPAPALAGISISGLQLISIPYKGALQDFYYPAQITKADYPNLVTSDRGVDTVAISTVLMALEAKPNSPRYKKLTQFTQTLFERFGALRDAAHHPKWREVNLAADVPGWRRFQPAQKWLDNAPVPRVSSMK